MESFESSAASILTAGIVACGASLFYGSRAFRTARLISSTPPTPIAQLGAGLHEVKGTLGAEEALVSPYSRRPCIYWHLVIEQRRKNRWEALVDRSAAPPVWLDDGSGRAHLDLTKAQVAVSSPARISSGIFGVPSSELSEVLEHLEMKDAAVQGPFLRYREEILEAGARVYAVASAAKGAGGWELAEREEIFVVSDRDETEVVRHQQRAGQRWLAVGLVGLGLCGVGGWLYGGL